MARMRRKGDLPVKTCRICARPFAWRRKWAHVWETIETCSTRCRDAARRTRKNEKAREPGGSRAATITEGNLILSGAETYRITGEPMGNALGLVSACETVKV
jgi:hypothetical protein